MTSELNSLPSDCLFREDINLLKLGKLEQAQACKEAIEERELLDSQLRELAATF
jgi:hypothetical protein